MVVFTHVLSASEGGGKGSWVQEVEASLGNIVRRRILFICKSLKFLDILQIIKSLISF